MGSTFFPIPTKTESVTADWLSSVLKMKIEEKSLVVTAMGDGIGFLSLLVRVIFSENCKNGSKKEHSYVVKLLPVNETTRELIITEKMDKTELYFYQKFIPTLLREIPSLGSYMCPLIYSDIQEEDPSKNIEYASVMILKDLTKDGYIMKPFSSHELTEEELDLTMDFFAKFHFAAHLVELREGKPLSELYDFFPEWYYPNTNSRKKKHFVIYSWFTDGFPHAKKAIMNYVTTVDPSQKELGLEIIAKLIDPLAPHAQTIFDALILEAQKFPNAIHGDLWQNNVLMNSNSNTENNKVSIKIIDWQLSGYSDTVLDLAMILATSLLPNITMNGVEHFARSYFDKLEKMYSDKEEEEGVKITVKRRTWPQFWEALTTLGFTFVFIQWIMSSKNLATCPENFPKTFASYRFFMHDAGLPEYLLGLVSQKH